MKQVIILLFLAMFLNETNAKILTVSNDPSSPAMYSTFKTAHDAAESGDTLYITGSWYSYGEVVLMKKLTIIGAGYNPTNHLKLATIFDKISLHRDDVNFTTPSDSRIIGIKINGDLYLDYGDNICVSKCQISFLHISNNYYDVSINNNLTIRNCIITRIYGGNSLGTQKICIQNNIIKSDIQQSSSSSSSIIVSNNVFKKTEIAGYFLDRIYKGFVFANNIFYGAGVFSTTGAVNFSTFSNNLSFGGNSTTFCLNECQNSGGNNLENVNPQFVLTDTYDVRLKNTSPCKNAGSDGTDIGLTGGTYPWPLNADGTLDLTGSSSIPQIIKMDVLNPVIPVNGTLKVNIIVKSQN